MSISTLIIDDELPSRNYLKNLIAEVTPELIVVGEAHSVATGIEAINGLQPDLVLLDIDLNGENSFDILEEVNNRNFDIIFITAYHEYAIKAIKHAALDYLLKPISVTDFTEAIERFQHKSQRTSKKQIDFYVSHARQGIPDRIILPSAEELLFVNINEIISIEAANNYCIFHLSGQRHHIVSKNILEYETFLPAPQFFRIHKSHLVNMSHINKYIKGRGGSVVMSDGTIIAVSVRKKDEFMDALRLIR